MTERSAVLERVSRYYGDAIRRCGPTPAGVDWKSETQQRLRFDQLLKVCGTAESFSLIDFGCGYGALQTHLQELGCDVDYQGYDICEEMLVQARMLHRDDRDCRFTADLAALRPADFVVASGIFNVKGETTNEEWRRYMRETVRQIASLAKRGFAFNALTTHVDFTRPDLYYADPGEWLNHCEAEYSRHVAVAQNYGFYEFTLQVQL